MGKNSRTKICFLVICLFTILFLGVSGVDIMTEAALTGKVKVTSGSLNVRTGPGSDYSILQDEGKNVTLSNNKKVTILSKKEKWYHIKFTYNKKNLKGYVYSTYVVVDTATATPTAKATATPKATAKATAKPTATPKATATPKPTPLSNAAFKKKLQKEGFSDDYITPLLKLHKQYPYWEFKAFKTGLKWNTVISNESKVGINLLSVNKSYDWKSTAPGAYDWKTDKYIPYDGSTWVTASKKAVKYYMDPRNFLDARGIFQFEYLAYQKGEQTQEGVEKILYNTPMYKKKFSYKNSAGKTINIKYSKAFINAAAKSKVSPYHLASRVKQEVVINSSLMSSSVSGTVSGYKGIYNFYNIGANNSTVPGGAVANGLNWASTGNTYYRPWNNRYKSIVGGDQYIGKNYINVGQNTLYLEKFNVTSKNTYNHQYMGNIEAPNSEASKTVSAYGKIDSSMPITFSIPIYENMPEKRCEVPDGGKNPNNYLKTLYVKNHAFTSKFVLGDDGSKIYKVTVNNNVSSIKICATKVSSHASISGTGNKSILVGTTIFNVRVKSESGNTRKYKIAVTRKPASSAAVSKK